MTECKKSRLKAFASLVSVAACVLIASQHTSARAKIQVVVRCILNNTLPAGFAGGSG